MVRIAELEVAGHGAVATSYFKDAHIAELMSRIALD